MTVNNSIINIKVNARYKHQRLTGVQRYASEIVKILNGELDLIIPPRNSWLSRGPFWEQFILPTKINHGELLWSPTNTGPIVIANQVVTIHDMSTFDHPEWFTPQFSAWYRFLLTLLSKRVKKVVTDSYFSKSRITSLLNISESKITVIYPGLSEIFTPSTKQDCERVIDKYQIKPPYLLYVGSIEPRKNLLRLVNAWESDTLVTRKLNLVLVGVSGYPFNEVKLNKLPTNVRILNNVNDKDLPILYSGALAFIYPSLYEGFGLPPLEAMACGTPVISSNTTSLPEVMGDAGLLIDPNDITEISQAILTIIEDKTLRDTLRERGFNRAKMFSWDITAKSVMDVLKQSSYE